MSLLDAEGLMNGDIWSNGAFDFDSPLKDLLDSGNYTLEQILAEDELLQELRGLNPELMNFFSTHETVAGLLQYIILHPKKQVSKSVENDNAKNDANGSVAGDENVTQNEETTTTEAQSDDTSETGSGENGGSAAADSGLTESEGEGSTTTATTTTTTSSTTREPGKWLQGEDFAEEETNHTQQQQQQQKTQQQLEDNHYIRYPYMACEVICCELKGVIDIIVNGFVPLLETGYDEEEDGGEQVVNNQNESSSLPTASMLLSDDARGRRMLDLLFSILYESEDGEIDDYRAGYFEKVLTVLLRNRPNDIAEYLNDGGGKGNTTLMSALFKHLYSHSLMQIVQRLMLPQPPLPEKPEDEDDNSKGDDNDCGELFNDTLEINGDGFESFRCNWSESDTALRMIVGCLTNGDNDNGNSQANTPSTTELVEDDENDNQEDRKLDLYRNSSEVLITIIQNSPLSSRTMCTLTTDPILETLIDAATHVEEGSEFSRHESRLTCAMSVLESLILQLGGYGSVASLSHCEEEGAGHDAIQNSLDEILDGDDKVTTEALMGEGEASTATSGQQEALVSTEETKNFATPATLIRHLPELLFSLGNLLLYPEAENWVSPTQFSKTKPQHLLGFSRLRIVRLLESLVLLGNQNVDSVLCESSCLETCLDLFWKFQWCSMLHQSVANLLVHVLEGHNSRSELQSYFIVRCNLLGRLMYSFWDKGAEGVTPSFGNESNTELSESIMGQKDSDSENSPTVSSVLSERGSSIADDVLPVSDDDVDAAMEQEQDSASFPELEASSELKQFDEKNDEDQTGDSSSECHNESKEPSLRIGYMGHVIIICQAVVQACTDDNDTAEDTDEAPEEMGDDGEHTTANNETEKSDADDCTSVCDDSPSDSLILRRLIKKHHLGKIWQDFVLTKLASETSLQATPLGGFQASTLGTDPLHMHRPGLEDDGGYDNDDGEAPSLPQRDHIDMDDNDLEVAASMMAGLNLGQGVGNNGDDEPQSSVAQSGYMFDDPLGGGGFKGFDEDDDDDDDDGDSSSDEEPDMLDSSRTSSEDETSSEHEAPVLDLFAGNFALGDDAPGDLPFSDFANFDDAFADTPNVDDGPEKEEKNNFDSIFGDVKSRDILLDDFDEPPENGIFEEPAIVGTELSTGEAEAV